MSALLLHPAEIGDAFRAEWRAIEAASAEPVNPFFCSWFLGPAMAHLGAADSVRLLAVREEGRLIGLAPVTRGETLARAPLRHFEIWRHPHAYTGAPLIKAGSEDAFYAALIRWIDERPEGARFLRFTQATPAETRALQKAGRSVAIERQWERAILSGGRSFDEAFAEGFSTRKRKELRRQWRRLGEKGDLQFERLTSPDAVAAAAQAFIGLEKAGWKGRGGGALPVGGTQKEAAFFVDAMTKGAEGRAVVCDAARLDGAPVAMLFSLRAGRTLSAFKIAHDEIFAAYSAGVQILVEAMRLMLDDKEITLFDSCARPNHPVADHLWRERMGVATFIVAAKGGANEAAVAAAAGAGRAIDGVRGLLKGAKP